MATGGHTIRARQSLIVRALLSEVAAVTFFSAPCVLVAAHDDLPEDDGAAYGGSSVQECHDYNFQCAYWSAINECEKNPDYMHHMCRLSCRLCAGDGAGHAAKLYRAIERRFGVGELREPPPPRARLEILEVSYDPRIYIVEDFVTDDECDWLRKFADPRLVRAKTLNRTTGSMIVNKVRTNTQMYAEKSEILEDPLLSGLVSRMHKLARIAYGHAEQVQIGRYGVGEFYEPHLDSEPAQGVIRSATVLVYLEAPEGGGETIFPKGDTCKDKSFFQNCCDDATPPPAGSLVIPPRKRRAVLFYSHDLDGRHNPLSMHGSCPVRTGEKWIIQQWFRSEPYIESPHFGLGKAPLNASFN